MYSTAKESRSDIVSYNNDGVELKFFPSRKIYRKPISLLMLSFLNSLIKDFELRKDNMIVYVLSQPHVTMTHLLSMTCRNRIPFVAGQNGPRGQPLYKFKFTNNIIYLFQHFIDWFLVRNFYDKIICLSLGEFKSIEKQHGVSKITYDKYSTFFRDRNGLDFSKVVQYDRKKMRRDLNLSKDKTYITLVGRYTKLKGLNNTIKDLVGAVKSINKLKKVRDVELLLIGGDKNEDMYDFVKSSSAIHLGYLDRETLMKYLAASDVYLHNLTLPEHHFFAGFGSAPTEALIQGTPVVSTQFYNILGKKIKKKLGVNPRDYETLEEAIEVILGKIYDSKLMYKISQQLFDSKKIVDHHLRLYEYLGKEYNFA